MASAFDVVNPDDSFAGVINVPPVLDTMLLRDLVPPSGLLQFPETMRDLFGDPSGKHAPHPGARLKVAQWPGCLDWRTPRRALLIKTEGGVVCRRRGARPSRRPHLC